MDGEIKMMSIPESAPQFAEFARDMLDKIGAQLGVSYEQMSANYSRMKPHVTPTMLRLATSGDRRQWKRAWKLYFQANGKSAPLSYFSWLIAEERARRLKLYRSEVFEQFMAVAIERGDVSLPAEKSGKD